MSLHIIIGPMFSSKSTFLLHKLKRYNIAQKRTLYINHSFDNRKNNNTFSTHNPLITETNFDGIDFIKIENTQDQNLLNNIIDNYDVIGIDEFQFFNKHIVDFVKLLIYNHNKDVIVCGLDGDFEQNTFGHLNDLIPHCDKIKKLHSICKYCNKDAIFTNRKTNNKNIIMVGDNCEYVAVCRKCSLKNDLVI